MRKFAFTVIVAMLSLAWTTPASALTGPPAYFKMTFDTPPVTTETANPVPGEWFIDRYPPWGFTSAFFDGDNRLRVEISIEDSAAARTANPRYSNGNPDMGQQEYDTQGRSYVLNNGYDTYVAGDLYVGPDWETQNRRSDLWGATYDASGNELSYPIIGFKQGAGFRVWNESLGDWVNIGYPAGFAYGRWYNLRYEMTHSGWKYYIDHKLVYTDPVVDGTAPSGSTDHLGKLMIQAYNFGESYDVYWDNVEAGPADHGPPETTATGIPAGWATAPVQVSLSATDPPYGVNDYSSGVKATYYEVGAGAVTTYTGSPFTVSDEGTTTVSYWSVDNAGNVEETRTSDVRIDAVAPVTTSDALASYVLTATVGLSAEDTASGVASTWYRLDGGPVQIGTTLATSQRGSHSLEFGSVDVAGNREQTKTADFDVLAASHVYPGLDRYDTAVTASRSRFPTGSVDTVIVATGQDFPDALAGAPLAGAYDSPLLLTRTNALPLAVAQEISRLGAHHAIILGGAGAVSDAVRVSLEAVVGVGRVTRIAGADRYATAASVAGALKGRLEATNRHLDGTVFVATGIDFPDALSAGPNAWNRTRPILLVQGATVPAATASELDHLGSHRGVVLGGTGAMPNSAVVTILSHLGPTPTVQRLGGTDRYGTAAVVADWSIGEGESWSAVGIATGQDYADALTGGPVVGASGGALLLTKTHSVPPVTDGTLAANRLSIYEVLFFGGDGAVSPAVRTSIMQTVH